MSLFHNGIENDKIALRLKRCILPVLLA